MYFTRHTINFTECSRVITILMGLFKALYHCHLYIFLNFIGWGGWVDLWKFDPLWQPGHWSVFHTQVAIKAGWPLLTLQVACFISLETQNLLPDQGKTTARLKTVRDSFIKPRNSINCCLCMVMQSLQFRNVIVSCLLFLNDLNTADVSSSVCLKFKFSLKESLAKLNTEFDVIITSNVKIKFSVIKCYYIGAVVWMRIQRPKPCVTAGVAWWGSLPAQRPKSEPQA